MALGHSAGLRPAGRLLVFQVSDRFDLSGRANVIDIGPKVAGPLLGISNTIATLPGILANLSAGWMLHANGGDYTPVFGTAIGLYLAAFLFYTWFAKGEVCLP